jgi:hypothetical protein
MPYYVNGDYQGWKNAQSESEKHDPQAGGENIQPNLHGNYYQKDQA